MKELHGILIRQKLHRFNTLIEKFYNTCIKYCK
jgi:hypothetical protein